MNERMKQGIESLDKVKEIIGEKYSFPQLAFYNDKTSELTDRQCDELRKLGWEGDGLSRWVYRGTTEKPNLNARVHAGYEYSYAGSTLLISDHTITRFRQRVLWRYQCDNAASVKDPKLASRIRLWIANSLRGDEARKELNPWLTNLTDDSEPYLHDSSRTCFVLCDRTDKAGKVARTCFSAICRTCSTAHKMNESCPEVDSPKWLALRRVFENF
jgi:hypothetical protein